MTDLSQFQEAFFEECRDLLQETEDRLMDLENGSQDQETLHAIFRAVHSIKGGGGAFGFDRLVGFAHVLETVFDLLRSGQLDLTPEILSTLMDSADILSDLVLSAMSAKDIAPDMEAGALSALADIAEAAGAGDKVGPAESGGGDDLDDFDFTPIRAGEDPFGGEDPPQDEEDAPAPAPTTAVAEAASPVTEALDGPQEYQWTIRFRPHPGLFHRANDPLLLARELKEMGTLQVTVDSDALPGLDACEPDGGYLSWTFFLVTDQDRAAIEDVFDFVQDDCDLAIEGAHEDVIAAEVPATPSPSRAPTAEPVPADAPAPVQTVKPATEAVKQSTPSSKTQTAAPAQAATGNDKQDASEKKSEGSDKIRTIRVELDKIDRMINMVGELVISQSMLAQRVSHLPANHASDIGALLDMLMQQMRQLQDNVMAVRASPVKTVFSRMPRLVRELSRALGKKVRIKLIGEETELDKTVIEQLADPLTHMIRNCMDHGFEMPEDRVAAGKPEEGTIELSAQHVSGQIQICIKDDGRGINREKVLKKAQEKGLVPANATLSDQQIDQLIFAPGFSTADAISDVSGRGVGTDVVRRNIEAMGGRVEVQSVPGKGCTFLMTLPLTLAIMDGMVLRVGSTEYVIPIASVVESAFPGDLTMREPSPGRFMIHYRGDYIPLVTIGDVFGVANNANTPDDGLIIICDVLGGQRMAIKVDAILGQQQVVVKSLEENFMPVPGIAAATILGDGRVSLILDVNGVMRMAA